MKNAELECSGRLQMPRSRGAVSGSLLVLAGAWGALVPFVGPHFNFAFPPVQEWAWTTARGWFEVLPGAAAVLGGLLLIASKNRAIAMFGGLLAVLAGAWFVVGPEVAPLVHLGHIGDPVGDTERKQAMLDISYFTGLGVLIALVGGFALAGTATRLARDVAVPPARRPVPRRFDAEPPPPEPFPAERASEAVTLPRPEPVAPDQDPRRWRTVRPPRQRAAVRSNASLRWPHPEG